VIVAGLPAASSRQLLYSPPAPGEEMLIRPGPGEAPDRIDGPCRGTGSGRRRPADATVNIDQSGRRHGCRGQGHPAYIHPERRPPHCSAIRQKGFPLPGGRAGKLFGGQFTEPD